MFDPYHKWLGIPPKDQPPNYYRLLAIDAFESDPEVIDAAANRQMAYVQQRATGEHIAESQKLLNELSAARLCLLDKKKKAAYDLQLKVNLKQQARRVGGGQEKPPRMPPLAGLKSTATLTDRAQAPPVVGAQPPSAEDMPEEDSPFSQSLRWMRVIFFVLGGGLFLFITLVIFLYLMPGPEKDHNNIADSAAEDVQTGNAKDNRTEKPPKSAGTAIYDVEIDPPSATIAIQNNMGTITGTGRTRQIRFDNIPWRSYVNVTASGEGFKPYSRLLAPRPGQNEKLSIVLQKEATAPLTSSSVNPPQPTANVTSNTPPASPNNPPLNPTIRINRPIDARPESVPSAVETPKTERRKVFVFDGESAIVTPVQRSLPSTVEAWIWFPAPAENAEMFVFGSDDAKLSTGGLGVCVGKNGQLGGRRTQKNKDLRDFWTGEFLPIRKWTHLAVTFDDEKIRFFVDGRLVHTDKGAQKAVPAMFVVGYIGIVYNIRQYNPKYTFVGKIREVRITSGIRYDGEFRPPFDFNKNQDKEGIKTSLIYDASNARGDLIADSSGNKKDGTGFNIKIVEEEFPIQ
ncbi:MAG: LamG domain-containing protein [Thermoguttaceae bacterium]|jgi:hypothetical protein